MRPVQPHELRASQAANSTPRLLSQSVNAASKFVHFNISFLLCCRIHHAQAALRAAMLLEHVRQCQSTTPGEQGHDDSKNGRQGSREGTREEVAEGRQTSEYGWP